MTISICINGQLLLMMLNEQVVKIGGVITSSNTDGSSILIKKDKLPELKKVFEWWQELTHLNLEYAYYSKQYYSNVNSYAWIPHEESYNMEKEVFEKNKKLDPKVKGCFDNFLDYKGERPVDTYAKNHSQLVVPTALIAFYSKGIPVEQTINECTDIFDFCKMVKEKGTKFKAVWYDEHAKKQEARQGKIVRYYIVKQKGEYNNVKLMKYLPPIKTETMTELYKKKVPNQMDIFDIPEVASYKVLTERVQNVEASSFVRIFNKYEEKPFEEYEVDTDYYVNECYKIINAIKQ